MRNVKNRTKQYGVASIIATVLLILSMPSQSAGSEAGGSEAIEGDRGFYLGIKFVGSSLHTDNSAEEEFIIKDEGGGVLLDIGYGFNRTFSLELSMGGSNHETSKQSIDAHFYTLQIFGYYRFSPQRPFRPYIKGGLGAYGLELDEGSADVRIEGGGVAFGGGFRYFFSPHFSMGVDLTLNIIRYDRAKLTLEGFSIETTIDEESAMTSLGLQMAYHF